MDRRNLSPPAADAKRQPRAFTLLELLVAVSILLILLAITATAIRVNNDADRVRGAGRTLQSYLLGAKDRAIYSKAPRGVRLLRDGANLRTVSSVVYIEPTEPWRGQVRVIPADGVPTNWNSSTNPMRRVRLVDTNQIPNWIQLRDRGLLTGGLRIRIPANDRGTWYVVQSLNLNSGGNQDLFLTTEIRNPNATGSLFDQAEIELPPSVVQNAEPVQLPRGVVIDLDRSGFRQPHPSPPPTTLFTAKFPAAWIDSGGNYTQRMDIMFSPRGGVAGSAAGTGVIHLYLTEQAAADLGLDPAWGVNATGTVDPPIPDKILVSIFTRTGNVNVTPVQTADAFNNTSGASGQDGYADDPFYYSERGEVAGK